MKKACGVQAFFSAWLLTPDHRGGIDINRRLSTLRHGHQPRRGVLGIDINRRLSTFHLFISS